MAHLGRAGQRWRRRGRLTATEDGEVYPRYAPDGAIAVLPFLEDAATDWQDRHGRADARSC